MYLYAFLMGKGMGKDIGCLSAFLMGKGMGKGIDCLSAFLKGENSGERNYIEIDVMNVRAKLRVS